MLISANFEKFIKNGSIHSDSNISVCNKYLCKASSNLEYTSFTVQNYQDLSIAPLDSKNNLAYMDGYDHIYDYSDCLDINTNNYYMSSLNIYSNIEESKKIYIPHSGVKDTETQHTTIYENFQTSVSENFLSIIYDEYELNLDNNPPYDDIKFTNDS
ncbi:hypothetical protein HZS_7540 [Henneguya salminicola]|nr:hypothetical protein HZS_7540 [Henneguya salminicola]